MGDQLLLCNYLHLCWYFAFSMSKILHGENNFICTKTFYSYFIKWGLAFHILSKFRASKLVMLCSLDLVFIQNFKLLPKKAMWRQNWTIFEFLLFPRYWWEPVRYVVESSSIVRLDWVEGRVGWKTSTFALLRENQAGLFRLSCAAIQSFNCVLPLGAAFEQ